MPPLSGTVKAVSSWIHQSFIEDFGEHSATRVAAVIDDNDISLRVLRSLSTHDVTELFPFFSFGQKRTFSLLLNEATALASPSGPSQTPITPPPKRQKTFSKSLSMSHTPTSPPIPPNPFNESDGPPSPSLSPQSSIRSPRQTDETFGESVPMSENPVSQPTRPSRLTESENSPTAPLSPQLSARSPRKRHETFSKAVSESENPVSPPPPPPNPLHEDGFATTPLTPQSSIKTHRKSHETFGRSIAMPENPVPLAPSPSRPPSRKYPAPLAPRPSPPTSNKNPVPLAPRPSPPTSNKNPVPLAPRPIRLIEAENSASTPRNLQRFTRSPRKGYETFSKSVSKSENPVSPLPRPSPLNDDGFGSTPLTPQSSIKTNRKRHESLAESVSISEPPLTPPPRSNRLNEADPPSSPPLAPQSSIASPHERHETAVKSFPVSYAPLSLPPRLNRFEPCDDFLVCVVGPSGVGKSSTLNALLDGHQVLPTSSMRASTAVPIEIRYKEFETQLDNLELDSEELPFAAQHDADDISQFISTQASEDKRFVAEIEFISVQDWQDYVNNAANLLQRKQSDHQDLRNILAARDTNDSRESADQAAMEKHCRSNVDELPSEAAALAAVRAVLGESNFATVAQIRSLSEKPKVAAILKHLGQSLRFSFDRPHDVSRRIERFLATSMNRRSAAVWPLVKSARIYGPWKMLSAGMVLVDLPGLQDANSARNQVVSSYIHRCHAIISAAKISRARDNKTTNDLLTGPIRRGIELGRVKFVGFIATHSDDVKPEEIIDDLQGNFSRNLREGLQQAQVLDDARSILSFKDIKRQLSRLHLLRTSSTGLAQPGNSSSDEFLISSKQNEMEELSKSLRSTCIAARNGFVSKALRDQFTQEIGNTPDVPKFSVFCVSSTQYVSIMREDCADVSRDFTDIRLTGIPSLSHCLWSLSRTTQTIREEGERATRAAFLPSTADSVIDEPPQEHAEELRGYLRSVLEEFEGDEDADAEKIRADMEELARASMAARESELADAEKRIQCRSVYLKEITGLNKRAADVLLKMLKHCRESSVSIASNRRVEMWFDQASEHTKEAKAKGAMIAILGDSGSGKSSLLNALLGSDGEDILPVSGVRACTAAPIAITHCSSAGFHAEIEFLGVQEWHNELFQLVKDLEEETKTRLKNKMPYFERPRSELGKMAYDKVMSVYGHIGSYQGLIYGSCSVENRLGTTAKLHDFSAKGIRRKLEAFCSSKSDDLSRSSEAGHLWPLVRVAHLKGPFKVLSDSGGCLLDLPGLQDSNSARNAVVQSYLGSCSGFMITAPIKRAVDNQTARDLLGRQFRRQLLLDGRINSVAFVATQADDIDALQVASELGVHGVSSYSGIPEETVKARFSKHAVQIARMRKQIKRLAKRKSELKSRLRRENSSLDLTRARTLTTSSASDAEYCHDISEGGYERQQSRVTNLQNQLSEVQTTISAVTSELAKREHVLNNICSLARNAYCRIQVREDFVEGIQEITDGALASSDRQTDSTHQLPVFTTSSNDFRFLSQNQTEQAKTFYTTDETGVPRLFQFIRHNMLVSRINAEYKRTERLAVLLSSLSQYLLMENRATTSQQHALAGEVEKILGGIDKSTVSICSHVIDKLNRVLLTGPLKKTLTIGGINARENASVNLGRFEGSVHWATYRACLRRLGVYVSPTAGAMNLNESLMAPLMETVIPSWREAFGTGVSKILQNFVTNAVRLADTTLATVATKVAFFGLSEAPLEGAGELRIIAKKSFDMAICEARACMEKEFEDLQRNCWQQLPLSVIQQSLKPGYTKANDESGPGCVARLKEHMRYEVHMRRSVMFDKCIHHINAAVKNALHKVGAMTNSKLKSNFVCLLHDIEVLWDSRCDLSYEKCVSLANELKNLTGLVDKIRIGSLALKKSVDGVDYDSPDSSRSVLPVLDSTKELAATPLIDEKLLENLLPKQRSTNYWARVKRENQLYPGGASHGMALYSDEESYSEGVHSSSQEASLVPGTPSPCDTDSEDWPACF